MPIPASTRYGPAFEPENVRLCSERPRRCPSATIIHSSANNPESPAFCRGSSGGLYAPAEPIHDVPAEPIHDVTSVSLCRAQPACTEFTSSPPRLAIRSPVHSLLSFTRLRGAIGVLNLTTSRLIVPCPDPAT